MAIGAEVNGKMVHTDEKPKLLQHESKVDAQTDESKPDKKAANKAKSTDSRNDGAGQQEALLSSK